MDNKVKAPARAGAIAPCDVKLQPQNTGLGPEKTSFFQALQIPTKISKGTIEILVRTSKLWAFNVMSCVVACTYFLCQNFSVSILIESLKF